MKVLDAIRTRQPVAVTNAGYGDFFRYNGTQYPLGTMGGSNPNVSDGTFLSMVRDVHEVSGPVSAAVTARALLLSQVEWAWKWRSGDRRNQLHWSGTGLERLDRSINSQMLYRLELDASYAGNAYGVRATRNRIVRLSPERVMFAFSSDREPGWNADGDALLPFDAEVVALIYNPNTNPAITDNLQVFMPGEFFHWMPEPDPVHWWRGSSWITSLIKDAVALDGQIADHQSKFFENAGTPNLVFIMDPSKTSTEIEAYRDVVNRVSAGTDNAHKNMFLGGGQDVKVVGQDFSKIGFKDLQGGLENRVSMRSHVPSIILGARESQSSSALTTSSYGPARRLMADNWFTPTIKGLCQAVSAITAPPQNSVLWHDPSTILFLQEDAADAANIDQTLAAAISNLAAIGGFDPDSVVRTIAPHWSGTLEHTGLPSVQQQQPVNDARTVMGRLGRVTSVTDLDAAKLVSGLSSDSAAVVHGTIEAHTADSIQTLRAEMVAAFQKDNNT